VAVSAAVQTGPLPPFVIACASERAYASSALLS
jgi:hypothetical protein